MEQLQYCAYCRILLKWSSCNTVSSAGYYCNGAVGVVCIVQDIIEMELLQYCAYCRIVLKWSS